MTRRDEMLALADDIERWRRGQAQGSEPIAFLLNPEEQLRVIAALRLSAQAEPGYVVKPLEWIACSDGTYHDADCQYEIEPAAKFWRVVSAATSGNSYLCDTRMLEEAKAAAQADFEQRIRSAITTVGTAEPGYVAETQVNYWADWLVDAVGGATQNRMFLRGDPEEDRLATEAILLNGKKAIRNAIAALPAPATVPEGEEVTADELITVMMKCNQLWRLEARKIARGLLSTYKITKRSAT